MLIELGEVQQRDSYWAVPMVTMYTDSGYQGSVGHPKASGLLLREGKLLFQLHCWVETRMLHLGCVRPCKSCKTKKVKLFKITVFCCLSTGSERERYFGTKRNGPVVGRLLGYWHFCPIYFL